MQNAKFKIKFSNSPGFTLLELTIVMGFIGILFALSTTNLLNLNQKASINTNVVTLSTDLKQQQVKAMVGDTQGNNIQGNHGIHFEQTQYTLFHNPTYSVSDSTNYPVTLNENVEFLNINIPASQIVFATGSGEIVGFSSTQNTFQIRNTKTNEQKTFQINRYGVITAVN